MLCRLFPLDKTKNSDGLRKSLEPGGAGPLPAPAEGGMAPLLERLMADYAATGLPPAYLPKDDCIHPKPKDEKP